MISGQNGKYRQSNNSIIMTICLTLGCIIFAVKLFNGQESKHSFSEETKVTLSNLKVERKRHKFDPSSANYVLHKDLLLAQYHCRKDRPKPLCNVTAEEVWDQLLYEGTAIINKSKNRKDKTLVVMEVGMHRASQCLAAAEAGLEAHCVEPSPPNFARVEDALKNIPADVKKRIHLYQMAAGEKSGIMLDFEAGGSTGDHVGRFDMWSMTAGTNNNEFADVKPTKTVQVPSVALDDIINKINITDEVFLLKIDTQGFEPHIFSGLTQSINEGRIQHITFEYWPKGMDLIAKGETAMKNRDEQCIVSVEILSQLVRAGYKLYAMKVNAHPKKPNIKELLRDIKSLDDFKRPLKDLKKNCEWYYELEERYPTESYKMGYWSDIVAVAPGAMITDSVTTVSKVLHGSKS